MQTRRVLASRWKLIALIAALVGLSALADAQRLPPSPRTFPEFAGTWMLDEMASTGELRMAPRISKRIVIATQPESVTLTHDLRLQPGDGVPPQVSETYRLDGSETTVTRDRRGTFLLVADMLTFTARDVRRDGQTDVTTDAYSVDGDVLTLHRQISAVSANVILTMMHPPNNRRHTFVYRRAVP